MKTTLSCLALICSALAGYSQKNLHLKATIKGLQAGTIIYINPISGEDMIDSVVSKAGSFTYHKTFRPATGGYYLLQIGRGYDEQNFMRLYLDNGQVTITGNGPGFKDAKASGASFIKDMNDFESYLDNHADIKPRKDLYAKAEELYSKKDTIGFAALRPALYRMDSIVTVVTKLWVMQHLHSPISSAVSQFQLGSKLSIDEMEKLYNSFGSAAKNNIPGKKILHTVTVVKKTAIGQPAPVFSQADTLGNLVSLADFRGKYVLVDFWASWCVPCRQENPNVVKAFQSYNSKGFTVLGVSFDQPNGRAKWLKAIHDDQLTWTHVSDLKFWNNAAGKMYDIQAIPANVLVDPNGIIIAKNLHGDELMQKLQELLGAPQMKTSRAFIINGTGGKEGNWYYFYLNKKKDSIQVKDGQFTLKGEINNAKQLTIVEKDDAKIADDSYVRLFIEPGTLQLRLDSNKLSNSVLTGSKTQALYQSLEAKNKITADKYKYLLEQSNKADEAYDAGFKYKTSEKEMEALKDAAYAARAALSPYFEETRQNAMQFFKEHPTSMLTATMLRFYIPSMTADEAQGYYDRLGEAQKSEEGKELLAEINNLRSGSPGSMATEFSGKDINGQNLALSDFKGKYVLIDFWASWCGPCRKGNPHLLKLYTQYKKKGFEIIGVSDDDSNVTAWKKAVAKDGIGGWKHVLRGLKRVGDDFDKSEDKSEAYGIHSLPTKILIDPSGKIIGRYGSGGENDAAMDAKLAEIFGS
ncbi:redoxin domain-containing protein [Chitinophaga pendula]|uniref:redoxin domain-containing protein n=1 Tax=Chitinophaga TaxID=79328 RepID=UPI000BB00885|nr:MULTISPECIES: redoxin domain-containing protein [Chitinophaga]ASZ13261.1 hypothetical protein CK934_20995 [Chitinophaga sp. MD30]UCJ09116.1 redoxin domain-containing protein [Chitinophaga pendula]